MDIKETEWEDVDWMNLTQIGTRVGLLWTR
jgi:hypothetical protein